MAAVSELIRKENGNAISFGDHTLAEKANAEDFDVNGNLYKVKTFKDLTFKDLTKLERDGLFVYESEPGTSVNNFEVTPQGVSFTVSVSWYFPLYTKSLGTSWSKLSG